MSLPREFTMNNGRKMPSIGFGTYRIRSADEIMKVVDCAISAGYRLFDTAAVYGNEHHLQEAFKKVLPKYGLERKDIFITSKLAPSDHGGGDITRTAFKKSQDNLGSQYIDLYLIHFPGTAKLQPNDPRNVELRSKSWSELVEIYDEGLTKSIGVSNYTIRHLEELMTDNCGVKPAVNQVEWHPYYYQSDLLQYCTEKNILLQAYCSFGGTSSNNRTLLQESVVVNIAKKLEVTSPQLLLAWALQQNVAVIPKSTNPNHIKQNFSLDFKIPPNDFEALSSLNTRNTKYAWDPAVVA